MSQAALFRSKLLSHISAKGAVSLETCLMVLAILLAASSFPVAKFITHAMPAPAMMCIRFLLAASFFAPFVFIKNGWHFPSPKRLLGYVILSVPLVGFFWGMFESLRYTSVMNTGALYTSVPAVTALYAFFINKETTTKRRALGLSVGTIGALWIVFKGDINSLLTLNLNKGDALFLLGCLFMGLYNPLVKRLYQNEPMEVMTLWVLIAGGVLLFLCSVNQLKDIPWLEIKAEVYGGIIYLSLFSTLITFFVMQFCTVRIGATRVASYGFLTPLFVVVLSVLLGLDEFSWPLMPGICLVLIAMYLIQKR